MTGICKKDPCAKENEGKMELEYVSYDGECVEIDSVHFCDNQCHQIFIDGLGNGICLEDETDYLLFDEDNDGNYACYKKYSDSVCDDGQVLKESDHVKSVGKCVSCKDEGCHDSYDYDDLGNDSVTV